VISLGLRLTISGGREAVIRLVLLVAAVGLGVGLRGRVARPGHRLALARHGLGPTRARADTG
jgi:hypothetical protein